LFYSCKTPPPPPVEHLAHSTDNNDGPGSRYLYAGLVYATSSRRDADHQNGIREHSLATRSRIVRALALHAGRPTGVPHDLMRSGPHAPRRTARVQASGRGAGPDAPRSAPRAPRRIAAARHVHATRGHIQKELNTTRPRRFGIVRDFGKSKRSSFSSSIV